MNKKILIPVAATLIVIQIIYSFSLDTQAVYDHSTDTQRTYTIYAENGDIVNDIVSARIEYVGSESITL